MIRLGIINPDNVIIIIVITLFRLMAKHIVLATIITGQCRMYIPKLSNDNCSQKEGIFFMLNPQAKIVINIAIHGINCK